MTTKEKIKKEISHLRKEVHGTGDKYPHGLNPQKGNRKKLHTFSLKGQFDDINIRERAYE